MAPVNIRLSEAIDEYCDYCRARALRSSTIKGRRQTLGKLLSVTGDMYLTGIGPQHIDRLFNACDWQISTRNVRRAVFASFFEWARNRRYMVRDTDPLLGWRALHVPEKNRLRVPLTEWERLFNACTHPVKDMLISLGLYTFLRGSEMAEIQMKHVDLDGKMLTVHRVKTGDYDELPIPTELEAHLRKYVTWYTFRVLEQGMAVSPEHYLIPVFRRGSCENVNRRYVKGTALINPEKPQTRPYLFVQEVLRDAGYADEMIREGVHTLRRSGARAYFDSLVDRGYDGALRRVQSMLGHAAASTTEGYLGLKLDRELRNRELSGQPMFPELQQAASETTNLRVIAGDK